MGIDKGPRSYENWKVAIQGISSKGAYEVPLFTDIHIVGEKRDDFGPYQFLNPAAIQKEGVLRPRIILRWENHLEFTLPDMEHTEDHLYHGGQLYDEITALSSLALGIRLKSGGITREFTPDGDIRGKPVGYEMSKNPILLKNVREPIISYDGRSSNLGNLAPLSIFPNLSPRDAIALVKASRLYQDALWIAESEPELAWIMFVSAIETAANYWRETKETAVEKLHVSKPDIETILFGYGGSELVEKIAELLAPSMGATKKFTDFLLEFLPLLPTKRPEEYARLSWKASDIKKTFNKIYDYRSKALHGSKRFPAPMCDPPMKAGEHLAEVPNSYSMAIKGGVWLKEDVPILLNTFEYIVRGALLNWWASLYSEDSDE
mgnify:CR=1 FL=1